MPSLVYSSGGSYESPPAHLITPFLRLQEVWGYGGRQHDHDRTSRWPSSRRRHPDRRPARPSDPARKGEGPGVLVLPWRPGSAPPRPDPGLDRRLSQGEPRRQAAGCPACARPRCSQRSDRQRACSRNRYGRPPRRPLQRRKNDRRLRHINRPVQPSSEPEPAGGDRPRSPASDRACSRPGDRQMGLSKAEPPDGAYLGRHGDCRSWRIERHSTPRLGSDSS